MIPLEVKSGKDYKRHSALNQLLSNESFHIKEGIVLCNDNVSVRENRIYYPIYMIMFFHRRKETPSTKIQLDISHLI